MAVRRVASRSDAALASATPDRSLLPRACAHHAAAEAILAAAQARDVDLEKRDLLGDAPIHSLLKAIEAAATSEVGATRLDALLVTLEVLGAEANLNAVDGSGNTAFAIGMMSSLPKP